MSLLRFFSRISIRLLAFNVLLVFLPAFGILSLKTWEEQLLDAQERAMVQQGRLLAAALAENGPLEAAAAERILRNLKQQQEYRLRVIDRDYRLLADSSRFGPQREGEPAPAAEDPAARRQPLYRLGLFLYNLTARLLQPPEPPAAAAAFEAKEGRLRGPEIDVALNGRYGSGVRRSLDSRSLTLFSALPIESDGEVVGVVLVSRSTYRILQTLYKLRVDTFRVVLLAVGVAAVLSLLVSTTIARPLRRLQREAKALLDRRGRLRRRLQPLRRQDEIGDLSRALAELIRRLEAHQSFIESFASDVSHELKNPLASIRTATELLAEVDDPAERSRFVAMVLADVARLERLLSGVREITQIDAEIDLQGTEPVALEPLLGTLIEQFELRAAGGVRYRLAAAGDELVVEADPARLAQVFENLLDNATGFSPAGGVVEVELERCDGSARITVRDHGPGIAEQHLERVFARFFSYRPQGDGGRDGHTGLGLAIVKAIVERYGGTVEARNADGGGAALTVTLPLAA
ncbi:MAG: HAMP domain-containing protein [Acidobacteria bacterium]|nr:MAG: HAMP domain-containing protein [Acidobacteriota bacterium]